MYQLFNKIKIKYGYINLFFYIITLTFAVLVKIFYRTMESFPGTPGLMLFLKPLSAIVGSFFGMSFEFNALKGDIMNFARMECCTNARYWAKLRKLTQKQ